MTRPFDPAEPIGPGRTVIEASAGTGKTFTIASIVARLLVVESIPLDRILVVTFTRAATAELKWRVRRRLVETLESVDGVRHAADRHMAALLAEAEPDVIRGRITEALNNFDQAQIFTIDGFGRRLLSELGFGSRLPVDLEPGPVDRRLVEETAGDLAIARYAHVTERPLPLVQLSNIGAAVMARPDARLVPDPGAVTGPAAARAEFARSMRTELERRMRDLGQVTYGDALMEVGATLADPHVGETTRRVLAERYPVALVDEAQDTDPTQWKVILDIFRDGRLVIIGDPKQSIYRFRGADIDAYLAAARDADTRTLTTNWRSDQPLLEALDALLHGTTFGDEAIAYHRVEAAPHRRRVGVHGAGASLSVRWFADDTPLDRRSSDDRFFVGAARAAVAADAAGEVVRMLSSGSTILDPDRERPIAPSDIAILCRINSQVDDVREQLRIRGVPSVAGRSGAVFLSPAAEQWRRLLHAIEHPERMDLVRLGAVSDLVGRRLREIAAMDDEGELELQAEMRRYQRLLHEVGVPAVFSELDRRNSVTRRMLARPDGERLMTDLTHIAEELHTVWRPGRIGSLVSWLEDAIRQADQRAGVSEEEPEGRQRRLETDAQAVQVLTIHAAKGLEFPVVLVPFGWDAPHYSIDIPVFHDHRTGERVIDVGGDWAEHESHEQLDRSEQASEEARRLYVALTRARHRVVVWWVKNVKGAPESTLGRLLARPEWKTAARAAREAGIIDSTDLHSVPEVVEYRAADGGDVGLGVATFGRPLDHLWTRASFSRLSAEHPLAEDGEEVPEVRTDELLADEPVEVREEPDLPMADLPRGARFGTLVHEILERLDRASSDIQGAVDVAVREALAGSGWDIDPIDLSAGILATATTPLGASSDAPTLVDVSRGLEELKFELPVRTDDGPVSLADIGSVMAQHLDRADPLLAYTRHLHTLDSQRFRGFLTGAIDLTMEMPDGRYVVLDYKTNALVDYSGPGLVTAMIEGNYVLQATLYQVALHRYLSWRLPGYDPERHLGGSIYLFLRGVVGPDTPVTDGVRQGVQVWKPPPSMIVALSRLFERDER